MDAADQIKALGDLEYRADLEPYLDPVSRYGFDPDVFQMGSQQKGFGPQAYSHYDRMNDTVNISESGLPSKSTQSHEYRHRGFAKLFKQYRKNPDFYEEKYPGIGGLLRELMGGRSGFNETITEFYDTDETYNLPAQYETTTPYSRGRTLGEDAGVVLARGRDYTDDPYVIERKDGLGMQVKKKTKQISGPARLDAGSPEELARRQNFIDYREQAPEDRDTENNLLFNKVLLLEQMAEDEYKNPQNFAQGGPVMRGIGTLNETARNMTRGPRGIGAYQQFAIGGPVSADQFRSPLKMPYGPAQQLAYQQPQFGMGGMQQGNGINQYGQYLEQTYGDPEFDQKRDTFLQEVQQKEQQTFGGMGGIGHTYGVATELPNPQRNLGDSEYLRGFLGSQAGGYQDLNNYQVPRRGGLLPHEMQLFASGGEAMGPPPTRGPDPQGIGYFQKFADGGPVYMNNGGEGGVESIKDGVLQTVFDVESNGDFNRWHDNAQNIPETPLTQMTVSEIMGYQGGENGPAAGAGQIKYNTFQYLLDTGTLNPDEVFSPLVQRKAHSRLLDRRGFNEWVQGELSNDGFIQRLAREYAAVPLAQDEQVGDTLRESGKSRYGGSNAHRISLDNMRNVLTSLKSPSMASEAALDEAMYAADYLEPQTMPLFAEPEEAGPDLIDAQSFDSGVGSMMPPTTGEELRQGFRPSFGSQAQQDDFEAMAPQNISMRERYSSPNMAAELVGGEEALKEGIGGLTESLRAKRAKLRPSEVEFGKDKGGVFRSLMPPRRKQKEYPRNDPDALFRGLGKIRGRTLRKGFTPYVQDVRGELT